MSDFILLNSDQAVFMPNVGSAVVIPTPAQIVGTGVKAMSLGKTVCVSGDEAPVQAMGCSYIAPPFTITGVGMLKIMALGPDQIAVRTTSTGKPVLLKGTQFQTQFQVMVPAQMPPPVSTPDPMPMYSGGTGMFITTNVRVKGT